MFLIISKYLIPKGYSGLAFFPFVIVRNGFDKHNKILVNHEKIHIRQQLELLVVPFFILYGAEYLFRLARCNDRNKAYRYISFEREAYENESNLDYLRKRHFWTFIKYF